MNQEPSSTNHQSNERSWACGCRDIAESFNVVLFGSRMNIFLALIPVCVAAYYYQWGNLYVFVFGLLSICSLAERCSFITDELAKHLNELLSGLVYATLNSSLELAISLSALIGGELRVVQMSLLGSILSDMLLIMGCCCLLGGFGKRQQRFDSKQSNMYIYLLFLSSTILVLPTSLTVIHGVDTLAFSRILAVIIMVVYICMCYYELRYTSSRSSTNALTLQSLHVRRIHNLKRQQKQLEKQQLLGKDIQEVDPSAYNSKASSRHSSVADITGSLELGQHDRMSLSALIGNTENNHLYRVDNQTDMADKNNENGSSTSVRQISSAEILAGMYEGRPVETTKLDAECEKPLLTVPLIAFWCVVMFASVTGIAHILVATIQATSNELGVPLDFMVGIVFAIVGNSAEFTSAVQFSMKDTMDYSVHIALGSSVQISMFLYPFNVIVGMFLGQPVTFSCSPIHTICIVTSALMVAFTLNNGRSNWLKGVILITVYVSIACAFWFGEETV